MEQFSNIKNFLNQHKKSFFNTSRPTKPKPTSFTVIADKIVDDLGQEVILQGAITSVNASIQEQTIQAMVRQGNNVIRLNLTQADWLTNKQKIDAIVQYANYYGMAIILSLQQQSNHQINLPSRTALTIWQQIASAYKNSKTVMFELFSEPAGINPNEWLNGKFKYTGYQELYDAVRVIANNIVIIDGLNHSGDLSFVNEDFNVNGHNIVYCTHASNKNGDNFINAYKGIIGKFPLIFYNKSTNFIGSTNTSILRKKPTPAPKPVNFHSHPGQIYSLAQPSYREKVVCGLLSIQNNPDIFHRNGQCKKIIENSLALCMELKNKHASLNLLEDILLTAQYETRKLGTASLDNVETVRALNDLLNKSLRV